MPLLFNVTMADSCVSWSRAATATSLGLAWQESAEVHGHLLGRANEGASRAGAAMRFHMHNVTHCCHGSCLQQTTVLTDMQCNVLDCTWLHWLMWTKAGPAFHPPTLHSLNRSINVISAKTVTLLSIDDTQLSDEAAAVQAEAHPPWPGVVGDDTLRGGASKCGGAVCHL